MADPLLSILQTLRGQKETNTPFMLDALAEFRRQQKPETLDPSGRKSIAAVLSKASIFKDQDPVEEVNFQRGFLPPGANFARGLVNRGKDPGFTNLLGLDLQAETPDISPIQTPNLEQGFFGKAAELGGEFAPEIIAGGLTGIGRGIAAVGTRAVLGGTEAGTQDIIAGRSPKEIAIGTVAGAIGTAIGGRGGGKAAAAAAKGLLGESAEELIFKEAIKRGFMPLSQDKIVVLATKAVNDPAASSVVTDLAKKVLKNPELPFPEILSQARNQVDIIEQTAARTGKNVAETVASEVPPVRLALPSGVVREAVRALPEQAERRTTDRIIRGTRRSQRLLTAGDFDMDLYRSVIANGDVGAFRVALSAMGLPTEEVEAIFKATTKDVQKASKGRVVPNEVRGVAFLRKFDDLTSAPHVPEVGGKANLLDKSAGDAVEAARSVKEGFQTPDRVVASEAAAKLRAERITAMAERLGESRVTIARLRKAISSEKPFRSLPGSSQFGADTGARNLLRNAGLKDKKRQDAILNALTRVERRDQQGIVKTILRDSLRQAGLSVAQTTEFMARKSPDELASQALRIRAGKEKLTGQIADALREGDQSLPHIKAVQKARIAMEEVADYRTPLSDESGMIQMGRILEGSPVPAKEIVRNAVEIISKKTPKGIRSRKILGTVILNQYLFRLAGRMRDAGTSLAALVGQKALRIPTRGGLAQFAGLLDSSSPASIRTAFTNAADAWRTGIVKEIRDAVASGKMLEGDIPEELLRANIDLSEFGTGMLGMLKRFPFLATRFNSAQDDFLTTLAYTMERNYLAARKASGEGLSGEAARRRMWQIVGKTDDTMDAQAWETARRVVFREKNPIPIARDIIKAGKVVQNTDALKGLAGPFARYFAIPFLRTPAIIAGRTIELTPFVQVGRGIQALVNKNFGQAAVNFGGAGIATAGLIGSYSLAEEGLITGNGAHLSPSQKDAAMRAGTWAPNSIRIGNRWVSYVGWGPVAAAVSVGANMYERNQNGDFRSPSDWVTAYPWEVARGAINATFMPAYARIIDGIAHPERYGKGFGEQIAGIFGGIGMAASVAESMDPERKFATGVDQGLQAITPGARGDLPAKAGTFGESTERPDNFFENLFFPRQVVASEDPLIVHMFSIDALPGRPALPTSPKQATQAQKNLFKFTPEEANDIRLIKGKLEREAIELFLQNRGGLQAYVASGRSQKTQQKQFLSTRNRINGKTNKIIRNLRLAGQPITERAVRLGLGE